MGAYLTKGITGKVVVVGFFLQQLLGTKGPRLSGAMMGSAAPASIYGSVHRDSIFPVVMWSLPMFTTFRVL